MEAESGKAQCAEFHLLCIRFGTRPFVVVPVLRALRGSGSDGMRRLGTGVEMESLAQLWQHAVGDGGKKCENAA